MRLFLAIELTEPVRQHLDTVQTRLSEPHGASGSVKWVPRENRHITLKFLGDVDSASIDPLAHALSRMTVEPMPLFAERALFFPRRGPVHVIAVGVGGDSGRLSELHKNIEAICEPLGFARERREYSAHITLGRARSGYEGSGYDSLRHWNVADAFPGPTFMADRFSLVESHLRPEGSEYRTVAVFPKNNPNIS